MRLKLWFAALFAAITVLSSCETKKDTTPASTLVFTLDGQTYHSSQTDALLEVDSATGEQLLSINGVTNNLSHHMELVIGFPENIVQPGVYEASVTMVLSDIQANKVTHYSMGRGLKVNLTSINSKHAEGTFSGTLTNGEIEKPLTDGTFIVNIK